MRTRFLYSTILILLFSITACGCGNVNSEATGNLEHTVSVFPEVTGQIIITDAVTPTTEPVATSTPTPELKATPTPVPTPTGTPVPEATPTNTPTPTETPAPLYTFTEMEPMSMWTTTRVNMRTLPDTKGEVIVLIKELQEVIASAQCKETGWYQITYENQTGYMCNDYLSQVKPTPTPTPSPTPTSTPKPTGTPRPTPTPRVVQFEGDETITIRMVGDSLIHGGIYKQCKKSDGSYNADHLFANVKAVIREADIAIINQETILVAKEEDYSNYPKFGSPYAIGQSAINAGFDVIAHATNHTMDKGTSGIRQTLDFWRDKDVTVLGIHETPEESDIDYVSCEGITISFVNYTYGLNGQEKELNDERYMVDIISDKNIEKTVATAKKNSDLMIAVLHVGEEYVYTPSKTAVKQVDRFIDAGADIVLCAHPHVVEAYGMRTTANKNTALVYYSLGNFISWQDAIPRMIGGMAEITIGLTKQEDATYKVEIADYTMIPLITHQPKGGKVTTYFLSDYTEEMCAKHSLFRKEQLTVSDLYDMYEEMVNEAAYLVE